MHRRKLGNPTCPLRFGRVFLKCDEQDLESRQGRNKGETCREGCGCRRQVVFFFFYLAMRWRGFRSSRRRAGMRRLGWDDEGLGAAELFRETLCVRVGGWMVVEDGRVWTERFVLWAALVT